MATSPERFIQYKTVTQDLMKNAVNNMASLDLILVNNSLEIVSILMQVVFRKKFVSPSSDFITILAGLESVDTVFFGLLDHISTIIKFPPDTNNPLILTVQVNAIRTANIAAGGAYQTSLASYFMHKDIFSSIISFIDNSTDNETAKQFIGDAFSLLGVLASYDKLEAINPYRTRLADFVDHKSMTSSIVASGNVWKICQESYLLDNAKIASSKPLPSTSSNLIASYYNYWFPSPDLQQNNAESLPLEIISLTLATYEFINVNKLYAKLLLECSSDTTQSTPFSNFLSVSTCLFQNQHKTTRAALYARLNLLILRIIVEASPPSLLLSENLRTTGIIISQQRQPVLPTVTTPRLLVEGVLDSLILAIRHNMKRSLDIDMYILAFTVIFQTIHLLREGKTALSYNWCELWKTTFSFIKYINSHPPDPSTTSSYSKLGNLIVLTLGAAVIHGETIFSDSEQYDDLLYKIIESSDSLSKFENLIPALSLSPSLSVLKTVINHYTEFFKKSSSTEVGKSFFSFFSKPSAINLQGDLTPQKVVEMIKEGYQTLSIHQNVTNKNDQQDQTGNYLLYDPLPRYNEADERLFLKKVTRQVIMDIQQLHVGLN